MKIKIADKQNIFNPKLNCQNQTPNRCFLDNSIKNDIFIKNAVTFTGKNEICNGFVKLFKPLKMSEQDFIKTCLQAKKKIGSGSEGIVYKIPIKGFDNYVLKITKEFSTENIELVGKLKDDFPKNNFGQPVAQMGEEVFILKKLNGKSLLRFLPKNSTNCNDTLKQKTRKYYAMIANIPQESFDSYVKDIITINKKNRRFDPNSGNIILNPKDKRFQITDFLNFSWNFLGDTLLPFFPDSRRKIKFSNEEIVENKKIILSKIFKAAKKHKIFYGMRDEAFEVLRNTQETPISIEMDKFLDAYLKSNK